MLVQGPHERKPPYGLAWSGTGTRWWGWMVQYAVWAGLHVYNWHLVTASRDVNLSVRVVWDEMQLNRRVKPLSPADEPAVATILTNTPVLPTVAEASNCLSGGTTTGRFTARTKSLSLKRCGEPADDPSHWRRQRYRRYR